MCIYALGTWRSFLLYCIRFGHMPKNYLQAKGVRERLSGPSVSTRVQNKSVSHRSGIKHRPYPPTDDRSKKCKCCCTWDHSADSSPKTCSRRMSGVITTQLVVLFRPFPQLGGNPVQHRWPGRKLWKEHDTKASSDLHFGSLSGVLQNKRHLGVLCSRS